MFKPNMSNGSVAQVTATSKGYTGHKMLDDNGLIHMNGRVYDPNIGRFLSADILVQAPTHSQSYNRYTYVWNNPLSMVDPSGYEDEAYCYDLGVCSGINRGVFGYE
ncbi:RHS repeat-associated core domain-containing protein [Catenovulum adriaticum]|uniref:RHS repeat-associated core domain-containing protein n=1 Tax=Catenovulum adriaticum TaxID=2984846 RepID=A0ABY7AM82_9ALTE|nr:RHS repeat-associated core domain-containing protein [Catenovulum sp. TS8]WAJ70328.1 RHS repeat-associated core domain-containing protein [Catenovulum sp. TS8]